VNLVRFKRIAFTIEVLSYLSSRDEHPHTVVCTQHRLRVHVAITTVSDAVLVSPHVSNSSHVLLEVNVPANAVLLHSTLGVRPRAGRRDVAGNTVADAAESSVCNCFPYGFLVDDHLGGVVDSAVRGLVDEVQRRLVLVALADAVARVDDVVRGAEEGQVAVVSERGFVLVVISIVEKRSLEGQLDGA
jgi:hypothetical protein